VLPEAESFSFVAASDARVLILGSIPGQRSLEEQQYYAHPRNAFWRIMGDLFGAGPDVTYNERLERLLDNKVALWDVLNRCERPGSLDSNIRTESMEVNNFDSFFANHDNVQHVFCNGAKSYELFLRHVNPPVANVTKLPSTSPAHAAMSYDEKLKHWSAVKEAL